MADQSARYLSTGEVRRYLSERGLSVSDETLRRWSSGGRLPCIRTFGGQRRFRVEDVEAILRPVEPRAEAVA